MTVARWHQNADARLRNSGDTICEHQRRVAVMCHSLAAAMGWSLHDSDVIHAARNHDEAERVLGDVSAPAKQRFPILRWVYAAHEWWVLRQMGHRWRLMADEKKMLRLCDRLDAYLWAKRCGVTGPEWTEAKRKIDRLAHDLGPEAVAWVERQDQSERATG